MYIKEYGKEFKIKNQILLFLAALLIGTAVYYLLPTGKQYAEKIYHAKRIWEISQLGKWIGITCIGIMILIML